LIDNSCVPDLSVAGKVEGFPAHVPLLQLNQKAFLVHLLVQLRCDMLPVFTGELCNPLQGKV